MTKSGPGWLLQTALGHWLRGQAFVYAAALAFFTVFSIAPVVLVAVAVIGLVMGRDAASGKLMTELERVIGSESAEFVQLAVIRTELEGSGVWATALGVGLILVGATTVFVQMQKALNAIWEVAPRPARSGVIKLVLARLISLALILAVGFVMLVSLLLSIAVRVLIEHFQGWLPVADQLLVWADLGLSLLVVTLLFAAIFRILPDVVLSFRDVLLSALVTALLFLGGRSVIALYLAHAAPGSVYGAAGSLVVLLLWVNYSSLILLFGAALTRANLEQRGGEIVPRNLAVRVRRQPVEEEAPA